MNADKETNRSPQGLDDLDPKQLEELQRIIDRLRQEINSTMKPNG